MVKKTAYVPKRGDVVWMTMNPQAGHEQGGRRPALVLSGESYNRTVGLAVVCPITNRKKGYPFEVPIPADFGVTGVILTDQVKSVDWQARRAEFIASLPQKILNEATERVLPLILG